MPRGGGDPAFARKFAALAAASLFALVLTFMFEASAKKTWGLIHSPQAEGCIPWQWLLLHKEPIGSPRRGDLLGYRVRNAGHPLFPDGTRMLKFVGGVPGDRVKVVADGLWINGEYFGRLNLIWRLRKRSGDFDREFVVPAGHFLMVGTEPRSYDGRYWGLIDATQIIGRAIPLF